MTSLVENLSLPLLAGLFALTAAAVWYGGSKLAALVDALTDKTGWGKAFAGLLLLGGITSLPEVAVVTTASATGNAPLAVNNLLGSASINLLLLALADAVYGRGALTAVAARPGTLMQGVLSMLLASAVALIAAAGDVPVLGVGVGSAALAAGAVFALWLVSDFEGRHVWEAVGDRGEVDEPPPPDARSVRRIAVLMALAALLILVAGFMLSVTADRIAVRTGLSSGIIGFVLVGSATSLPEVSSVVAAVRLRRYELAIGDIFGTNLFNIMLLLLADLAAPGPPVLSGAGRFELLGAILAVFMTGIYIVGLLDRRDRAVLRMGYDSLAALAVFGLGLAMLARWSG